MSRTNIDIDEVLIARAMHEYGITTKRAAVDFALRQLLHDPMTKEEVLEMQGTGWDGNLVRMRSGMGAPEQ